MNDSSVRLQRDCEAIAIPSGALVNLNRGSAVRIMQRLGDHFTVGVEGNLYRIDGEDADALGLIDTAPKPAGSDGAAVEPGEADRGPADPSEVRHALASCYDPEIPVDIVELGLVYRCDILTDKDGGSRVEVDMTLTAPGCGMGAVLATDVRRKLLRVPGVSSVEVRLVYDPPWSADRMSEVARLKLGLL
ncbi:putative Fe-S cluster assembly protein SufT [Marinobacterium sp. D7]|uniref:putative Fe-S cluster assembly protein SufT n=1 Tax=Marinobacterium ramblicola TaxID=2849041 RepID=UPI001C2D2616|nr:putative Fe-S cluster assembly protein SufT [Marinobacterium ramblicola]MBV1789833.1 putative Fe-S cluster assembly protein SufT [Marinobacterium ramblicola]